MPNTCVYNPKKHSNIIKKSLHKHNKQCYTKGNNCKKQYNKPKKVIIKLDDNDYLKKIGYSTKLGKEDRHKVLLFKYNCIINKINKNYSNNYVK